MSTYNIKLGNTSIGKVYFGTDEVIKMYFGNNLVYDSTSNDYPQPTINVDKIEGLSEDIVRGVDVSSVISLEQSGVKFYDFNGNECDIFKVLKEANVNYARIKIWNNPYNSLGQGYGGGNSDLAKAITLGKRATQHGLKVLIDFHYSDFWADPSKQKAPKAWQDYSVSGKADAIYNFTKQSLQELINNGIDVGMVQVGNETGYSFCGCATWDKTGYTTVTFTEIAQLMNAGSRAIREVDPNILVVVHNTDPQNSYQWISRDYNDYGVDYDVFASSYYPNIHGSMENLTNELKYVADTYGKKVMVAETQYPYTTEDTDGFSNTLSSKTGDMLYDISIEGQAKHVRDVFEAVNNVGTLGIGVFYWDASWIAIGSTWNDNVGKWDEFGSGWATKYANEYDSNADATYSGGSVVDNQAMFDSTGHPLDSLNVFRYIYTGATSSSGGNAGGSGDSGGSGGSTSLSQFDFSLENAVSFDGNNAYRTPVISRSGYTTIKITIEVSGWVGIVMFSDETTQMATYEDISREAGTYTITIPTDICTYVAVKFESSMIGHISAYLE